MAPKKQTFETFKERASAVHGGKYEYVASTYAGVKNKLSVVCSVHGIFVQQANSHLQGVGCPECAKGAKRLKISEVVSKLARVHGNRYTYPSLAVQSVFDKVKVICAYHGHFKQRLHDHLRGQGCPRCACPTLGCAKKERAPLRRVSFGEFLTRARAAHGDQYAYPVPNTYTGLNKKVEIVCPVHGVFSQKAQTHVDGHGCPACNQGRRKISFDKFLASAAKHHADKYEYPNQIVKNGWASTVEIICPTHGSFSQKIATHLQGGGCPACGQQGMQAALSMGIGEFVRRAIDVHGEVYDYAHSEYTNGYSSINIGCPTHGSFRQLPANHLAGLGCPRCGKGTSRGENELVEFIQALGLPTELRQHVGGVEFDIAVPAKGIVFEYNGVYWHSTAAGKGRGYHRGKMDAATKAGLRLVHVFEDDWQHKQEVVKSRVAAILGFHTSKHHARKTEVCEVSAPTARQFLAARHLQGFCPATLHLGLRDPEGILVAIASFARPRFSAQHSWELLRFCSEGQVIGGAGKLLKHFQRNFSSPGETLLSYADRCWSTGGLYQATGFEFSGSSEPGFTYAKKTRRYSRQMFQKHKLAKLFDNFDPELTEEENCRRNGYYRVYDCGVSRWIKTL